MSGEYLTRILLSRNGVKAIVGGMITSETDDWRKFEMVGRVIATPPKGWTAEKYYQHISSQVVIFIKYSEISLVILVFQWLFVSGTISSQTLLSYYNQIYFILMVIVTFIT